MYTLQYWQSTLDPSILVLSELDCLALAKANPTEAKYRSWVKILVIQEAS